MRYTVTVAGRTVLVDLTGPEPIVDGTRVRAELVAVPGTPIRQLLLDRTAHAVVVSRGDRPGSWRISLEGRTLVVEALDERTRALREMTGGGEVETDRTIRAPMPGMVVRIEVKVGDEVRAGQGVAVVEAMKMENELVAPADGTVARIDVSPGQAVEKGAILMVIE